MSRRFRVVRRTGSVARGRSNFAHHHAVALALGPFVGEITPSSIHTAKGPADWFTGDVYIDSVAAAPPPSRVTANLVHFMPGARTHWHHHPLSQTVFVTEGIGVCQRRGGPVEIIRPGDRVLFEANEEHWHGAAPNRLMVHVAINEGDDQHDVVHWLQPVTDDEYAAATQDV